MGARTKQLLILPRRIREGIAEEVALRWAMGGGRLSLSDGEKKKSEKGESGREGVELNERTQSKARRQQLEEEQLQPLLSSHQA